MHIAPVLLCWRLGCHLHHCASIPMLSASSQNWSVFSDWVTSSLLALGAWLWFTCSSFLSTLEVYDLLFNPTNCHAIWEQFALTTGINCTCYCSCNYFTCCAIIPKLQSNSCDYLYKYPNSNYRSWYNFVCVTPWFIVKFEINCTNISQILHKAKPSAILPSWMHYN